MLAVIGFSTTNAQTYMGFDVGFHLPNAGGTLPGFEEINAAGDTTALLASLDIGLTVQLRAGKWINNNVAVGINARMVTGLTKGDFEQYLAPGVTSVTTVSGKAFFVSPNITVSTDNSASKSLFVRFGPQIGFGFNSKAEVEIAALETTVVQEFVKGSALGFNAALGGKTAISDKMELFAELELSSIMHKPKELKITTTTPAGTTETTLTIVETTGPSSSPTEIRTIAVPYSGFGLNVGVLINL